MVRITIPPTTEHGETIRYPGLGDTMNPHSPAGDLYVSVHFAPDEHYEKRGIDLLTTLTINSLDAIIGCEKIVNTLSGKSLKVKIPPGTQYGTILNLRNEGLIHKGQAGSILVQIVLQTPKNLTPAQLDHARKAKGDA
jgi:molecular chaperone DnaJ